MCGIFGLIQRHGLQGATLLSMSAALRHRGPDDEGVLVWRNGVSECLGGPDTPSDAYATATPNAPRRVLATGDEWQGASVALGHRRLSILDLSPRGHQPMSLLDRYWITYNGEVYNYLELRDELAALGYRFTTGTDTEVILAAYDRWGVEALRRFNGMWGFAILDTVARTLFLARDRFGVKPLYYQSHPSGFAFSSEIKALPRVLERRATADLARVLDFLVWNVSDHTDSTFFAGVRQLPAGHYALVQVDEVLGAAAPAEPTPIQWYTIPEIEHVTLADAADQLRAALADSVALRLRADVPVGSCLSGGLDSSSLVCLMADRIRQLNAGVPLRTITARSDDSAFNEEAYADTVVRAVGAEAFYVTPEPGALFRDLDRLIWHQDEPFLSTSIYAQWCVFQEAKARGVTVMLDGQGADEILGGYRGYFGAYLGGLARGGQLGRWMREVRAIRDNVGFGVPGLLGYTAAYAVPAMLPYLGRFDGRAYSDRTWIRPGRRAAFESDPVAAAGGRAASVNAMGRSQVRRTHLPMLLHWEDRNSMAFSIEARVPFLDYRVVELCLSMPPDLKLGGGVAKRVLRESMQGLVPEPVLARRDKMGFVTAEKLWATRDDAATFRRGIADAVEVLPEIVDPSVIGSFDEVVAGRRAFDQRYWRVISAGRWARTFGVA